MVLAQSGIDYYYDNAMETLHDNLSNERKQQTWMCIVEEIKCMLSSKKMEDTRILPAADSTPCQFEKFKLVAFSEPAKKDPIAIKVRMVISRKMASVYTEMCGLSLLMSRNVFERGSSEFTMNPVIDSMGVVFTATEIMRVMCPGESSEIAYDPEAYLELTLTCRIHMAAAFFMAYKMKTEEGWRQGTGMPAYVLSKFVCQHEFGNVTRRELCNMLSEGELAILAQLKIHSISEYNIYSVVEYKLEYLLEEGLITPLASCMALSVASFYLYLLRCVTDTEFLETACKEHGGDAVCLAVVAVCISSIMCSFTVDINHLPKENLIIFDYTSLRLALEMVDIRINCKEFITRGFPSLCCLPVAKKAKATIAESIEHWKQPTGLQKENLENQAFVVKEFVNVS